MLEQEKIREVKKLIQQGFDLDLISFELEIPIEKVRQYKNEIESDKSNKANIKYSKSARDVIAERNAKAHEKMEWVKRRYNKLFSESDTTEVKGPKQLSQKQMELRETVISTIEERMEGIQEISKSDRRGIGLSVLGQIKKIEDLELTIEQAEKLYTLISSEYLKGLRKDREDKIDYIINLYRKRIINQWVQAIDLKQKESESIEELRSLERRITVELAKESPVLANTIKRTIANKITQIQQKNAIDRIRNDISENISAVITDLVNGNIDMEIANKIIDEEARNKVASKPKTKFGLTEDAERRQILIQIRTAISEKADKYEVENPETLVAQIQELCKVGLEEAVRIVVNNLVARKDFKTARSLCDKFADRYKDTQVARYITNLKYNITNAEFGDIILKGIKTSRTIEEESAYVEMIEKALATQNIRLSGIPLGKSKDGLRDITLADVWTEQKDINKFKD